MALFTYIHKPPLLISPSKIIDRRKQLGLSLDRAISLSGVPGWAMYESGRRPRVREGTLRKLATTLGLKPEDLLATPAALPDVPNESVAENMARQPGTPPTGKHLRREAWKETGFDDGFEYAVNYMANEAYPEWSKLPPTTDQEILAVAHANRIIWRLNWEALRDARIAAGLTMAEAGKRAELGRHPSQTWAIYEKGKVPTPQEITLRKMATAVGVDMERIATRVQVGPGDLVTPTPAPSPTAAVATDDQLAAAYQQGYADAVATMKSPIQLIEPTPIDESFAKALKQVKDAEKEIVKQMGVPASIIDQPQVPPASVPEVPQIMDPLEALTRMD